MITGRVKVRECVTQPRCCTAHQCTSQTAAQVKIATVFPGTATERLLGCLLQPGVYKASRFFRKEASLFSPCLPLLTPV